ncbi:MAG: HEPN domain-containing protein [Candidatus Korarchaeum sp.]
MDREISSGRIPLDEHEYLRWLNSAKRTLESAHGDLSGGDYNWACFKAQQAAELAVKALLRGIGSPSYGHSIAKLLMSVEAKGIGVPEEIMQRAKTLDKYYVPTRYPNAWAEGTPHEYYTEPDATDAINCAREVISWIEGVWGSLRRGRG